MSLFSASKNKAAVNELYDWSLYKFTSDKTLNVIFLFFFLDNREKF